MNKNNNLLYYIVGGLAVVLFAIGFGGNFVIDKIANRVIYKLQKDYSPSPYGPGIDPDRLDVDAVKKGKTVKTWENSWDRDR